MQIVHVALMIEKVHVEQLSTLVSSWYHGEARKNHQYRFLQNKNSIL
jgi:hypothetical protein